MTTKERDLSSIEADIRSSWKSLQLAKRDAITAREQAEKELRDSIEAGYGVPSAKEIEALRKTHFSIVEDFIAALQAIIVDCDGFLVNHASELTAARLVREEFIAQQAVALKKILPGMKDNDVISRVMSEASCRELSRRVAEVEGFSAKVELYRGEVTNQIASLKDSLQQLSRKYRSVF